MKIKQAIKQAAVAGLAIAAFATQASAASYTSPKTYPGDSRPSQTGVTYTHSVAGATASTIRCIKITYSSSASSVVTPTGFTAAAATFTSTTMATGTWTLGTGGQAPTANTVYAINSTGATQAASGNAIFGGITNGSAVETGYFATIYSYSDAACTTLVDSGVSMFIFENGQAVTATVDPTLTFTIAGVASGGTVNSSTTNITTTNGTIPFGTLSSSSNKIGAHDLTVGTNAQNGYTVYARYTGTLQNAGANVLDDWTGTNASPTTFSAAGTEAFGYTTEDITLGTGTVNRFNSNKWAAFTTTDAEVAYNSTVATAQTTRVGYQVGIAAATQAGSYTTTIIYTAVPTY